LTKAEKELCAICNVAPKYRNKRYCNPCIRERKKLESPEAFDDFKARQNESHKRSIFKKKYNISEEIFNDMLKAQGNKCAICFTHQDELSIRMNIDHDHTCCPGLGSCGKCLRGLLCRACNMALGGFRDDVVLMQRAIDYLRKYEGVGQNY
jgi:hypothetical protein